MQRAATTLDRLFNLMILRDGRRCIFGRFFDTDWTGGIPDDKSRCFLMFVRERTLNSKGTS
ncbi:MAG TPA: hypothetical protein DDW73_20655 [Rhizobium sp.]|nr:hypothetical protein [Rhizobium sp.]